MSDPAFPAAAQQDAASITKSSKSNLALAFIALPRARRRDITTFYAFCRLVDDIADAPGLPVEEKRRRIRLWRDALADSFAGEPPLAREVRRVMARYMIPRSLFEDIIAGVEMDLTPRFYKTFDDLRLYCYRVASAVGLVSIEIFGYRNLACKHYAMNLGMALQLTNILRDVAEDLGNGGRVYLPLDDLEQFGLSPENLVIHRGGEENFRAFMRFEAERALSFYAAADAVLPPEDRRSMVAAEIMRAVYGRLLEKMRAEDFRVFEKRYTLSALEKTGLIVRTMAASLLGLPAPR